MALYFIGLGLNNEKDISWIGLETIKKCDKVYLDRYTSILNCSVDRLAEVYGKKIIIATRDLVESEAEQTILKDAKESEVAFLVAGDPMCATTHIDLYLRARKAGIKIKVINNASIISAIGITGLQVYKFGKTTSIPFDNENVETPYDALKDNIKMGMHTLFLLDLRPNEHKFMSVNDAIRYLLKIEIRRGERVFTDKTLCIGCARIGSDSFKIKKGSANELLKEDFGNPVQCLVVPGKLHFLEEEALEMWK